MDSLAVGGADDDWQWHWVRATPWEPQALSQKNFPPIVAAALVEAMLYGIYVLLFALTIVLLLSNRMRLHNFMLAGLVAMLCLSTADIALTWRVLLREPQSIVRGTTVTFLRRVFPKFMIYVSSNMIAAGLLIVRCYVVWGQRWYIIPGFGVPLLVATGLGYACQLNRPLAMQRFVKIFVVVTLVLNNALTILTAARIWWLSRRVSDALGRRKRSQYRTTSAIIVESGVLYSLSLLVLIGLSRTIWVVVAGAVTLRVVCIAPVMIIVQIALGHGNLIASRNTERSPQGRTNTVVLDTIVNAGSLAGDENSSSMQLTTHASSMGGGR